MEFVAAALNYLLGIPVLGWGTEVGFVYKGLRPVPAKDQGVVWPR